jgi:hypothetical protein
MTYSVFLPKVEWNAEKAALLWEVIARSKASENARTDCNYRVLCSLPCSLTSLLTGDGLAAHLQVPLPYLLYRAQMRYEEGLRGLHGRRALNAPNLPPSPKGGDELVLGGQKPSLTLKISNRVASQNGPPSSSTRLSSPLSVRARLNSLGSRSARSPIIPSSSTSTLQGLKKSFNPVRLPPSPSPPGSSDSEDDDARKAEEFESQEALAKRLNELQKMMTKENLGLVRSPQQSPKGKEADRGQAAATNSRPVSGVIQRDELSSQSQSASSANSPQNSVPSMPSPTLDSQRGSPTGKPPSSNSSSPPPSSRSTHGQSHLRFGHLVLTPHTGEHTSELGSTHGTSSASSFSDISG